MNYKVFSVVSVMKFGYLMENKYIHEIPLLVQTTSGGVLKMKEQNETNEMAVDIEKLQEIAQEKGLTYNQAKAYIAKTSGGTDTAKYSNTDFEKMREELATKRNE